MAAAAAALADPRRAHLIWKACAGPLARLPSTGDKVYYFPKGHADQCGGAANLPHVPTDTAFPCTVTDVQIRYHPITDAPYAVISLDPRQGPAQPPAAAAPPPQQAYALKYYVRQLEGASDYQAFSVPKACADELFPPLADPVQVQDDQPKPPTPNQDLLMLDVHGQAVGENSILKHRRSAKNQSKLTSGWRKCHDDKKLQWGKGEDGVVIMRCAEGEGGLIIGFRRGKPSKDLAPQLVNDVVEGNAAAGAVPRSELTLDIAPAAPQKPFTVQYNPRQGWPFVVPRKEVDDARQFDWQAGNKVRMPIPEDEHELPVSRRDAKTPAFFEGVITAVDNTAQWCKLQVAWDESPIPSPNSFVNTWQVQLVEPSKRKSSDAPSSSRTEPSKMPRHDIT